MNKRHFYGPRDQKRAHLHHCINPLPEKHAPNLIAYHRAFIYRLKDIACSNTFLIKYYKHRSGRLLKVTRHYATVSMNLTVENYISKPHGVTVRLSLVCEVMHYHRL